jgi:hypothetical protein
MCLWNTPISFSLMAGLGFEFRTLCLQSECSTTWATHLVLSTGYLADGVSWTLCLGWPHTAILLVSAFQVARIIGIDHWCLLAVLFLSILYTQLCFYDHKWTIYIYKYLYFKCILLIHIGNCLHHKCQEIDS